jgi:hypothetical protein
LSSSNAITRLILGTSRPSPPRSTCHSKHAKAQGNFC